MVEIMRKDMRTKVQILIIFLCFWTFNPFNVNVETFTLGRVMLMMMR